MRSEKANSVMPLKRNALRNTARRWVEGIIDGALLSARLRWCDAAVVTGLQAEKISYHYNH
ncbi:hypothetical protein GCM10022383_15800 [Microbacterium soli]|uniref:Uncharacterized protein n=1 Tax=Microbacterium soli TaxID=446075 RepID=A0ABP7N6V1_9MICO